MPKSVTINYEKLDKEQLGILSSLLEDIDMIKESKAVEAYSKTVTVDDLEDIYISEED